VCKISKIRLINPTDEYLNEIWNFKNEFHDIENGIEGTSRLAVMLSPEDWLIHLKNNVNLRKKEEKRRAIQYIAINQQNKVVGMLNIRLDLNDYLFNYGGHIGYSVRPSERKKGYGYEILKEAITHSKELGVKNLLLVCNDDNIPSIKVIEKNNGVLENKVFDKEDNVYVRRYFINL
jgi:predicted acetyltransferase